MSFFFLGGSSQQGLPSLVLVLYFCLHDSNLVMNAIPSNTRNNIGLHKMPLCCLTH